MRNVHGKEDTLITIQIDQMLAEIYGMEYVDTDGVRRRPYIIHRTSLGCYERTLALMLEKFGGAMPLWLAPEQLRILPIADRQQEYAEELRDALTALGMRVSIDDRNEKIGYKIRQAQVEKIPYMFVLGDKELENKTVSVRSRKTGDLGVMPFAEIQAKLLEEIAAKTGV